VNEINNVGICFEDGRQESEETISPLRFHFMLFIQGTVTFMKLDQLGNIGGP
jgi:hypothetical protein